MCVYKLHKYVVKRFSCGRGRYIIAVMITPVKFIILKAPVSVYACDGV